MSNFLNLNLGNNEERQGRKSRLIFNESDIFPILTEKELLGSVARKKWLNDIKISSLAPPEHYEILYDNLIKNFVEMVQILPVNNEARLYSLLDEGLLRGVYVLDLQCAANTKSDVNPLMQYVLFSAALLFDIGFVLENRMVIISSKEGDFVREWYPHFGAMLPQDGYYRIRRGNGMPTWLCRKMAVVLAKQLMPEVGFDWIAKDSYALNVWLSLLNADKEGGGELSLFFNRAEELLDEFKTTQDFFIPLDLEIIDAKDTQLGDDFLKWLQEGIVNGTISTNKIDSNIQNLEEGVLVNMNSLLDTFVAERKVSKERLYESVSRLGIVSSEVRYRYMVNPESLIFKNRAAVAMKASSLFSNTAQVGKQESLPATGSNDKFQEAKQAFFTSGARTESYKNISSEGRSMALIDAGIVTGAAAKILLGQVELAANNAYVQPVEPKNADEDIASKFPPINPISKPVPYSQNI